MANSTTVSSIVAAGLKVGSTGSALSVIKKGTVSVTISALAADAEEDITLTITGAAAGDLVALAPNNSSMETGVSISAVWISAADTVKLRISNQSGSGLTGSTATWDYVLIKS